MAATIKRRTDPELIKILNPLYVAELTTGEEMHVHEHLFETLQGYDPLADVFDTLVSMSRCRKRHLLNSVVRFGGRPTSKLETIGWEVDVKPALALAHKRHADLFDDYSAAYEKLEKSNSPNAGSVGMHLCKKTGKLDEVLSVLEQLGAQADDLSNSFLLLCIKKLKRI